MSLRKILFFFVVVVEKQYAERAWLLTMMMYWFVSDRTPAEVHTWRAVRTDLSLLCGPCNIDTGDFLFQFLIVGLPSNSVS